MSDKKTAEEIIISKEKSIGLTIPYKDRIVEAMQEWNECEQDIYGLYSETPIAGTNDTITNSYKYTEDDLRQAMIVVLVSNSVNGSKDIDDYINSLNKQD